MINKIDRELDGLESWQVRYPLILESAAVRELEDYLKTVPASFPDLKPDQFVLLM